MEEQYIPLLKTGIYAGAVLLSVLGISAGFTISSCISSKYKNQHSAENTRAQNELEQSQNERTRELLGDEDYSNLLEKRQEFAEEQIERWQANKNNAGLFPPDLEETLNAIFGKLKH